MKNLTGVNVAAAVRINLIEHSVVLILQTTRGVWQNIGPGWNHIVMWIARALPG